MTTDNAMAPDAAETTGQTSTEEMSTGQETTKQTTSSETPTALDSPAENPTPNMGDWPSDWREKMLGSRPEDEVGQQRWDKEMTRLKRSPSPLDVYTSYRNLERRTSSSHAQAVPELPDNPSDEQVAEYRKAKGIPEEAKGYYDAVGDIVIGEEDKPHFDDFFETLHQANADPAMAKMATEWFYDFTDRQAEMRANKDLEARDQAVDELRQEWGAEYQGNMQMVTNLLGMAPEGVADRVLSARLADGTPLFSDKNWLRFMVKLQNEINPGSRYVPTGSADPVGGLNERKAAIEKMMKFNRKEYNADKSVQEEYRKIVESLQKLQKKQQ